MNFCFFEQVGFKFPPGSLPVNQAQLQSPNWKFRPVPKNSYKFATRPSPKGSCSLWLRNAKQMTKKWAIGERAERRWTHTHALKHEWRAQFVAKKAAICVDFESFSHGSEWLPLLCVAELPLSAAQKNKVGSPRVWLCQPRGFLLWVATCSACENVFGVLQSTSIYFISRQYTLSQRARFIMTAVASKKSQKPPTKPLSMAYRAARRRWDFLCTKLFTTAHSSRNVTQNWVICEFDGIDWTCWDPFLEVCLFFRLVNYFIN
jgi:hypothetical protein